MCSAEKSNEMKELLFEGSAAAAAVNDLIKAESVTSE